MTNALADGIQVNRSIIRLIKDDITDLDVDAFVFYAQPDLALGSGFGGEGRAGRSLGPEGTG